MDTYKHGHMLVQLFIFTSVYFYLYIYIAGLHIHYTPMYKEKTPLCFK